MAVTSGFFNAIDHDRRYDALQVSQLFDGLIRDGIFASIGTCFVVTPNSGNIVNVGIGRAWFDHTWIYNDAVLPITLPLSEVLMDRIDVIVLDINNEEAVRANTIKVIKGAPSTNPVKPTLIRNTYHKQYPLAYIRRPEGSAAVEQRFIENCVGTSTTPFVTGILEVMDLDKVLPQWRAQLEHFMNTNQTNFNNWFAMIKASYNTNWTEFVKWEEAAKKDIMAWFNQIANKLGTDPAVNLQIQINQLGTTMQQRYIMGLDNGSTEFKNGAITESYANENTTTTFSRSGTTLTFVETIKPKNGEAIYTKTIQTVQATTSKGYLINESFKIQVLKVPTFTDLVLGPYTGTADVVAEINGTNYDVKNVTKGQMNDYILNL